MRKLLVSLLFIAGVGLFYDVLINLARLVYSDPLYNHVVLIPLVSLYVFWINKKDIFSKISYSPWIGGVTLILSLSFLFFKYAKIDFVRQEDLLFVSVVSMVIWLLGAYLLVCGRRSFQQALFPLFFLIFIIPIPSFVMEPVVHFLQTGSALSAKFLLKLLNVPAYMQGFQISVPGVTVEVAEECSGIRSGLALLILCVFCSYLYLKSNRRRFIFVILSVPVTIFKNGMRVVTLALLGAYVDISYLTDSALHRSGGKPFFIIAMVMMIPVFWVLKRNERKCAGGKNNSGRRASRGNIWIRLKEHVFLKSHCR